jgi:hypothetical protein
VFRQAAQVVAALATIELPAGAWPGLVGMLAGGVREGGEAAARQWQFGSGSGLSSGSGNVAVCGMDWK